MLFKVGDRIKVVNSHGWARSEYLINRIGVIVNVCINGDMFRINVDFGKDFEDYGHGFTNLHSTTGYTLDYVYDTVCKVSCQLDFDW